MILLVKFNRGRRSKHVSSFLSLILLILYMCISEHVTNPLIRHVASPVASKNSYLCVTYLDILLTFLLFSPQIFPSNKLLLKGHIDNVCLFTS